MDIYELIENCDEDHKIGLEWFKEHNGEEDVPFVSKINDVPLVSPAQGIFKPKNSDFVLSVKQTLKMVYDDRDPIYFPDGSWLYVYHQRGESTPKDRKSISDNIALYKNLLNKVPVGVSIQTKAKGKEGAKYSIGFGLPIGWIDGFFIIYCANKDGEIDDEVLKKPIGDLFNETFISRIEETLDSEGEFDPSTIDDSRKKMLRAIKTRQGQPKFRKDLIRVYKTQCVITGSKIESILEAAHITPYKGKETNDISNGFLLRADIHTLWDKYLLTVDSKEFTVKLHPEIEKDEYYSKLEGKQILLPENESDYPSQKALEYHNSLCSFL